MNQRILDSITFSMAVYAENLETALSYLNSKFTFGVDIIHQQGFPQDEHSSTNNSNPIHHQPLLCAQLLTENQHEQQQQENEMFVACRGTSNMLDVLQDLKCLPAKLDYAARHTAHWGFAQRADSIPTDLFLPFLRSGGSITFTGHSLGGAVASLLAIRLLHVYPGSRIRCITFGAPLFASSGLAELITARYRAAFLHVVLRDDCVPKVLPFVSALQRVLCDDDHWEGFRTAAQLAARLIPRASPAIGLLLGPMGFLLRMIVPFSLSYEFAGQVLLVDSSRGSVCVSGGREFNAWHSRLIMAFWFWRDAVANPNQHSLLSYEQAMNSAPKHALLQSGTADKYLNPERHLEASALECSADAPRGKRFPRLRVGRLLGVIGRISRNLRALQSVCLHTFMFRAFNSLVHRSLVVERAPLPL